LVCCLRLLPARAPLVRLQELGGALLSPIRCYFLFSRFARNGGVASAPAINPPPRRLLIVSTASGRCSCCFKGRGAQLYGCGVAMIGYRESLTGRVGGPLTGLACAGSAWLASARHCNCANQRPGVVLAAVGAGWPLLSVVRRCATPVMRSFLCFGVAAGGIAAAT